MWKYPALLCLIYALSCGSWAQIQPTAQAGQTQSSSALKLADGTPIKLRVGQMLSSADAQTDGVVRLEVVEDVCVGNSVVIFSGTTASAVVTKMNSKKVKGALHQLALSVDSLNLADGTKALLRGTRELQGENIREFAASGSCGVLWTSHNMYEVQEVCDRVLFLSRGKILLEGDPRRLPEEHGKASLEDLGSTVATTDTTGAVATQYSYEPYGNTSATGSLSSNAFQYTGRENDSTGLYFYRARYYSPRTQRFISQDPIGFAGGDTNLYAYAFNSPTNFIDPSGLCAPACTLPIAAGPPGWVIGAGIAIATLPIWGPPAWQLLKDAANSAGDALSRATPISTPADPNGRAPSDDPGKKDPCKKAPKRSPNAQPPKNAPQLPPKEIPPGWNLRQMPGASSAYPDFYPYGYWILYNPFGQPVDPSTMKPGRNPKDWHIPYPEPCE